MIIQTWSEVLIDSFQKLWAGVIGFAPNFVVALVIVLLGWFIGSVIGRLVAQVIKSIRVDEALRKAGVEEALRKGGVLLNSGGFLGALIKWFIIVVFLVAAFNVLGLTQVNDFLTQVVLLYLPRVIVAVLVLLLSAVIGDVMQKIVLTSAKTAQIRHAKLLGAITKWSIWIFAVLVALTQLGIATALIQTLFTGFVIALSLAVGLSFGLGGQQAAADYIGRIKQEISHRE